MKFNLSEKEKVLFIFLILGCILTIIYFNSLQNKFVYDDAYIIVDNIFIKSPKHLPKILTKDYFILSGEQSYRPVVTLSYFLDFYIWQLNPFGYHFTNLVLHIVNSQLVCYLTYLITGKLLFSFFASLVFATHPVQSEVVNAVSFREDLLAFLFFVLSIIFFLKNSNKFIFLSYISYLFSLFSKEVSVTLPFIILLYVFLFKKEIDKRNKVIILGYFLILLFYLMVRFKVMINPNAEIVSHLGGSFYTSILTQFSVIIEYLKLLFYPINLCIIHEIKIIKSITDRIFITSFVILVSILALVIYKNNKIITFATFLFFITLLPTSNIIPIYSPMAERYLYLPIIGFCIILGYFFENAFAINKRLTILSFLITILSYSTTTYNRNFDWENNEKLWTSARSIYPNNWEIRSQLGTEYLKKGLYNEAMREYQISLNLNPQDILTLYNVGILNLKMGEYEKSLKQYNKLIRLKPNMGDAYYGRGSVYFASQNYDKAIKDFKKAIELNPYSAEYRFGLAVAYSKVNMNENSITELKKIIDIAPTYIDAYFLISSIYYEMKQFDQAIKYLNLAKMTCPSNIDIYRHLGKIYLEKGDYNNAMLQYKKIIEMSK